MKMFIFTIDNLLWGTMYNVYFWGYLAFYMASYVFLLPFFFHFCASNPACFPKRSNISLYSV